MDSKMKKNLLLMVVVWVWAIAQRALQNDFELTTAITVMGQIMADRGFPLKLLEQEIKSINEQDAEDEMLTSKSGGEIAETPYDRLKKKAKCDIILQLGWKINHFGPRYSFTFTRVSDSAINKYLN